MADTRRTCHNTACQRSSATRNMSTTSEYFVGGLIGEGAYGRVVHAQLKSSGRNVAIKVMEKIGVTKRQDLIDQVWQERALLQKWNSRQVVKLLASFHDSECLYFVMECCTGGDLTHWISCAGPSNEPFQRSIPHFSLQLVAAIEFIHTEGVLHADLKPDNLLMTQNGRLKLADFGSAILLATRRSATTLLGTIDYASPELIRGSQELSVAVDLWSLGCILHAMWIGRSPFHADSDVLCISQILDYANRNQPIILPPSIRNSCWQQLITGLLQPNPSERLGLTDFQLGHNVTYPSIRSRDMFENVNLSEHPPYLAPQPNWLKQTQVTSFRDGADGWSNFLL